MMSNQSVSVVGLSDGNEEEDDTIISVRFLFSFFDIGADGVVFL
jgi:hypothetical protein